jgi:hypothetical protein
MVASLLADVLLATVLLSVGSVEDFDAYAVGPFQRGRLDSWRWSPEQRAQFQDASLLEIVDAPPEKGRVLRVHVRDRQVLANEPLPVLRLAAHFPPEADALRIRVKPVTGNIRLYAGGPTAYYANSDVFTAIHTLSAADPPASEPSADKPPAGDDSGWQTIELSLNHPLWRNQRRAGISTGAPRNYYNRWAQEPLAIYLAEGSQGEFLIDRIDLVTRGEGKPFPQFAPEAIERVHTLADFEQGEPTGAFNWYLADGEAEWFEQSWRRTKPLRFTPARLSVDQGSQPTTRALYAVGPTAEEVHGTAIRTKLPANDAKLARANALQLKLRAVAPGEGNTLVGGGPVVAVDFFVFVAAPQPAFDWEAFAAPAELRALPGPGFDYQFSSRTIRDRRDIHFALYQTRRFVSPETWTSLVLPAADFTCIYGHGQDRSRFTEHQPLQLKDTVAVGWLLPWCRAGRRGDLAATHVDDLHLVHVPGTAAELRSYWQISSPADVRLIDTPAPRGPLRRMLLPGEQDGWELEKKK